MCILQHSVSKHLPLHTREIPLGDTGMRRRARLVNQCDASNQAENILITLYKWQRIDQRAVQLRVRKDTGS